MRMDERHAEILLAVLKERRVQRERCERTLIELDATARIVHRSADWRST